jgi:streptogramin lyase
VTLLNNRPTETERNQEALFRKARKRRRRRWLLGVGIAVLLVAMIAPLVARTDGRRPVSKPARLKPPPSTPTPSSKSISVAPALMGPEALAIASDSGVLIDEQASNQIVERDPNGDFRVIGGNGRAGFSGDGGPATAAELDSPVSIAVATDGTVYVADLDNNRIRAISPEGVISTLAHVAQPDDVAVGPSGDVYVADQSGVVSIAGQGAVTSVITPTTSVSSPNGVNPVVLLFVGDTSIPYMPDALAVSSSGDIYLAEFSPKVIVRFPPDGPASLIGQTTLGTGEIYVTPGALAPASDGSVVVGDYGRFAIDRMRGSSFSAITSFRLNSLAGLHGTFRPSGVAVAPNGEIYAATDGQNGGTNVPALLSVDPNGDVHLLDKGLPAVKSGL